MFERVIRAGPELDTRDARLLLPVAFEQPMMRQKPRFPNAIYGPRDRAALELIHRPGGGFRDYFRVADNPGTISPCDLGTRCLTATTCKACASSPGGQEQRNFGTIGPPYGSIIRAWHPRGMASTNLKMYRTFAL